MDTQADVVVRLNATAAQLDKIRGETVSQNQKIADLLAIISNMPDASPDLVSAAASLQIKTDTIDALVADLPVTPPTEPPTP